MRSHLSIEQWNLLLGSLGLEPAAVSMLTTKTRQPVPAPYLNSGVLFVPANQAADLVAGWTAYVDEFVRQSSAGVDEPWTGRFLDQVALACALLDRQIPVRPIGPQLNLTTAIRLRGRISKDAESAIRVLHYHKHVSADGLLLGTDSPAVNHLVDRVNAEIAARTQRSQTSIGRRERAARVVRRLTSPLRS